MQQKGGRHKGRRVVFEDIIEIVVGNTNGGYWRATFGWELLNACASCAPSWVAE